MASHGVDQQAAGVATEEWARRSAQYSRLLWRSFPASPSSAAVPTLEAPAHLYEHYLSATSPLPSSSDLPFSPSPHPSGSLSPSPSPSPVSNKHFPHPPSPTSSSSSLGPSSSAFPLSPGDSLAALSAVTPSSSPSSLAVSFDPSPALSHLPLPGFPLDPEGGAGSSSASLRAGPELYGPFAAPGSGDFLPGPFSGAGFSPSSQQSPSSSSLQDGGGFFLDQLPGSPSTAHFPRFPHSLQPSLRSRPSLHDDVPLSGALLSTDPLSLSLSDPLSLPLPLPDPAADYYLPGLPLALRPPEGPPSLLDASLAEFPGPSFDFFLPGDPYSDRTMLSLSDDPAISSSSSSSSSSLTSASTSSAVKLEGTFPAKTQRLQNGSRRPTSFAADFHLSAYNALSPIKSEFLGEEALGSSLPRKRGRPRKSNKPSSPLAAPSPLPQRRIADDESQAMNLAVTRYKKETGRAPDPWCVSYLLQRQLQLARPFAERDAIVRMPRVPLTDDKDAGNAPDYIQATARSLPDLPAIPIDSRGPFVPPSLPTNSLVTKSLRLTKKILYMQERRALPPPSPTDTLSASPSSAHPSLPSSSQPSTSSSLSTTSSASLSSSSTTSSPSTASTITSPSTSTSSTFLSPSLSTPSTPFPSHLLDGESAAAPPSSSGPQRVLDRISTPLAAMMLRKSMVTLFEQKGFTATSAIGFDILSEIVQTQISKIGKAMRSRMDKPLNPQPVIDLLLATIHTSSDIPSLPLMFQYLKLEAAEHKMLSDIHSTLKQQLDATQQLEASALVAAAPPAAILQPTPSPVTEGSPPSSFTSSSHLPEPQSFISSDPSVTSEAIPTVPEQEIPPLPLPSPSEVSSPLASPPLSDSSLFDISPFQSLPVPELPLASPSNHPEALAGNP